MTTLDHFIWATPNLDDGIKAFEKSTGILPRTGGSHAGNGTRNALVGVSDAVFFEIFGPDPDQSLAGTQGEEIAKLRSHQLFRIVMTGIPLGEVKKAYAAFNIPAAVKDYSRINENGLMLEWSMVIPDSVELGIFAPLFIDWQDCPHPAQLLPQVCSFGDVRCSHPQSGRIARLWRALGVDLTIGQSSKTTFGVDLHTPAGVIQYGIN